MTVDTIGVTFKDSYIMQHSSLFNESQIQIQFRMTAGNFQCTAFFNRDVQNFCRAFDNENKCFWRIIFQTGNDAETVTQRRSQRSGLSRGTD